MLRRRIAYILLILSAAILYLFANETVTLALLASLCVAPLISLTLLRFTGKNLKFELVPRSQSQGATDKHRFTLRIENPNIMPIADVQADVICRNLRTSENEIVPINDHLGPRSKREISLEVVPGHVGRYEISLNGPKIYDVLGLWSRRVGAEACRYITIPPEIFNMEISATSSDAAMLESDRFAESKAGHDPGEVKSIREYVAGDQVKNIHWKLSEKTGKTLIKEFGLPITEQFLVVMDTAPDIGLNPEALDAVASVLVSLSHGFRNAGMNFSIGWTNPDTGKALIHRVETDYDLGVAVDELLSVPATSQSAFETIDRSMIDSRFAHLVLVSSRIPEGIESITNGCKVTILLYGEPSSTNKEGISILGFNGFSYQSDLAVVEV